MKEEIKVPSMGESISEVTIGEIFVSPNAKVNVDQELLELETDKVNQVIYAPASGVFIPNVSTGDTVAVGSKIGEIDTEGAPQKEAPKQEKEKQKEEIASKEVAEPPKKSEKVSQEGGARVPKEEFLKEKIAAKREQEPEEKPQPKKEHERETRKPMTRIRQIIASRLLEAQNTTAMLTTFNEVDMTEIIALRNKYKDAFAEKFGVKLGFMSFFVKACVSALQAFPDVNAYIDGSDLVQRHYYHIGVAVGTERGLVVPVIKDCDQLSYSEVEKAIVDYASKARKGGLSVDNLQGGGFTITNGGVYGSLLSTPILNPPQCGILGMHKIQERPVALNGQVVIRPMMYIALSYDHRIVDGKEAVSFLVHLKEFLEYLAKPLIME
ncbi:MAG: 2-oxoglutarate dehydrogenase complex dihydrolipoyllysine-residue succinyltransferase [Chlamydiales bacterium]